MTQAGGPAAINGFLYQIIHHIGWLADVTLTGKLDGRDIEDACLVLEPRNGGDARAEASGIYLVEQYKTRKDGTWALSGIESVLCDLRKAVQQSRPMNACYRFVTDGQPGRLDTFIAFLADVKSVLGPDDLDHTKKGHFRTGFVATNREYFDHILDATRSEPPETSAQERAVVFHLLSRFEMEFGASGSARANAVETLLRPYTPNLGDECKIREHLIGVLVEKLSNGEARLDAPGIDEIFRQVGLSPDRLRKMGELAEAMSALMRRRLKGLKYQSGRDVRPVPEWPEDKAVLVIAGESGAGKTWQVGRLLEACGQTRRIATLVPSAKTREDLLTQASRDLWQSGLGETSEKSLIAVSHFLREITPDATLPRVIVALDDVQDVDLARDLVRQDWADWDMRLVLTVPRAVAQALQLTDAETIHVHSVGDFSVDELDALLTQSGHRWADLPPDLKKLLRNPILAGLFVDLPYASIQRAPRSEYEIFERFWTRIAAKGRLGDEGIVTALAAHMYEGKPYPLPRPLWHEIGLAGDEAITRLEAAGWLLVTEGGDVAFAHDRLLNWAVAKSLVHRFQRQQVSINELGAFLASEGGEEGRLVRRRLSYVPMDALWLLAADTQSFGMLGQLVARLEESRNFGSFGEDLYVHLLPTLGQWAVPILIERLSMITAASDSDYRITLIGKAFATLAKQDNIELKDVLSPLLSVSARGQHVVAIAILTAAPDRQHLDRLWEIHQHRLDALENKSDGSRHSDYQASFAALRAGVALYPEWLRNRILAADVENERVSDLGYLLNGLEHSEAPAIWKAVRDVLMDKVTSSKPRSLLYCIARFGDREKLDFVIHHLSCSEDFASGAALAALTVLDPKAAIDRLTEVQDSERYMYRNNWLPTLLRAQPELTRQRILQLAESDPKGRRHLEMLFGERPDDMDETILRFALRMLERDLREYLDDAVGGDPIWIHFPLDLFGRVARPELLAMLEAEAGGELERMITTVACSRLSTNSNYHDHVRESARRVLILMGGNGITTLIKRELESEHFWVRHGGLNWAFVRADDGILARLAAIARRPVPRDANGKCESNAYQEFYQAMTALAALGADAALVKTVFQTGIAEVPGELEKLRAYRGPMPKTQTDQALRTLRSSGPAEESLLIALVIAWLSGDAELISPVRVVLEQSDLEGRVAAYACIALQALGDCSDDFAQLAQRLLDTKANSSWGINALASLGNRGLKLLGNQLMCRNSATRSDHDIDLIRILYDHPATRKVSVDAAVDCCLRGSSLLDQPYDIAGEADEPAMRELILDKAFAATSIVTIEPLRAIEGLAKFDATRAVEAIELGLQSHPKIELQLCRLLVRIAPETAAARLINAATSIDRESLRRAAGRVLRRLDPGVVSNLVVERMSGSVSERKVVAELAGWLPIPAIAEVLGRLADHDSANEVRHAALAALNRHSREVSIRTLLASFPSAVLERRWSLLVAILDTADPYLLTEREDALWLGSALLSDVPAIFRHHANSVLRQRMEKEE